MEKRKKRKKGKKEGKGIKEKGKEAGMKQGGRALELGRPSFKSYLYHLAAVRTWKTVNHL